MEIPVRREYVSRRPKFQLALLLFGLPLLLESSSVEGKLPQFQKSTREIIPGMIHVHLHSQEPELWDIYVLEVDPKLVRLRLVMARDQVVGKETTSSLATRYQAAAAVNAGFFETVGPYQGDFDGFFSLKGLILSDPVDRRSSLGICERSDTQEIVMDQFSLDTSLFLENGELIQITGINRARGSEDVILYTPQFGEKTLTEGEGVEFLVEYGRVRRVSGDASNPIPKNGFVVSVAGDENADAAASKLKEGMNVALHHNLSSAHTVTGAARVELEDCDYVSAGPALIRDGIAVSDFLSESGKFEAGFSLRRHPRTAVGQREDGTLVFVVVDGRQPKLSVGMSLPELAELLLGLGVSDAYNLDGGGATTMVIQGKIVNSISDRTGEQPVSDAILFFPRGEHSEGPQSFRKHHSFVMGTLPRAIPFSLATSTMSEGL